MIPSCGVGLYSDISWILLQLCDTIALAYLAGRTLLLTERFAAELSLSFSFGRVQRKKKSSTKNLLVLRG